MAMTTTRMLQCRLMCLTPAHTDSWPDQQPPLVSCCSRMRCVGGVCLLCGCVCVVCVHGCVRVCAWLCVSLSFSLARARWLAVMCDTVALLCDCFVVTCRTMCCPSPQSSRALPLLVLTPGITPLATATTCTATPMLASSPTLWTSPAASRM